MARERSRLPAELLDRIPATVLGLCRTLEGAGHRAYLVGGAVRDLFLPGQAPAHSDWDVATSARPEQVMGLFERAIPTGARHGTVTVLVGGEGFEVTTFRGEAGYSDGRRPDSVTFLDDIEGDLARRDFTMNAMALDPRDWTLLDPHSGREALSRRILVAVGDPVLRFGEDGLRALRAARFAAVLELEVASGIVEAMAATRGVFERVSGERKRDEILKMMAARRPSPGWDLIEKAGMIAILFPGLERTVGCLQGGRHLHDVWAHSLACVDEAPPDPVLRLAALLHDAAKPETAEPRPDGDGMHFVGHERIGADLAARWLEDLRFSRAEIDRVVHLFRHHMVIYTSEWTDAAVRRFIARVGREHVGDVLDLAGADLRAQGLSQELLPLLDELRARVGSEVSRGSALGRSDLAVDGRDLMDRLGIGPGPELGAVIAALLDRVVEDPALNTRETLLDLAARMRER